MKKYPKSAQVTAPDAEHEAHLRTAIEAGIESADFVVSKFDESVRSFPCEDCVVFGFYSGLVGRLIANASRVQDDSTFEAINDLALLIARMGPDAESAEVAKRILFTSVSADFAPGSTESN